MLAFCFSVLLHCPHPWQSHFCAFMPRGLKHLLVRCTLRRRHYLVVSLLAPPLFASSSAWYRLLQVFCMLFAEPYIAASDAITSMIGALQAHPTTGSATEILGERSWATSLPWPFLVMQSAGLSWNHFHPSQPCVHGILILHMRESCSSALRRGKEALRIMDEGIDGRGASQIGRSEVASRWPGRVTARWQTLVGSVGMHDSPWRARGGRASSPQRELPHGTTWRRPCSHPGFDRLP